MGYLTGDTLVICYLSSNMLLLPVSAGYSHLPDCPSLDQVTVCGKDCCLVIGGLHCSPVSIVL